MGWATYAQKGNEMLNTEDLRHYTGIGTGYSQEMMMQRAADEIDGLRTRIVELLEILRNWEPDHASAEDRRTIMQAMYQTGILTDPAETLRNMAKAPSYGPDNPPRLRKPGESVEEYRAAIGWGNKTSNLNSMTP